METNQCVLCGHPFREPPNSAQPIVDGLCCARCDDVVVTPVRLHLARPSVPPVVFIRQGLAMHAAVKEFRAQREQP
jgi:hypothetical protein